LIRALKDPFALAVVAGMSAASPSHDSWIDSRFPKPDPTTVTVVPAAPLAGETLRVGPAARTRPGNTTPAMRTTIIDPVATMSVSRPEGRLRGAIGSSTSQRSPSQNAI
jgi:hypothetical protein